MRRYPKQEEIFEQQLNNLYGDKGLHFATKEEAREYLSDEGFEWQMDGTYKKHNQKARLTTLCDTATEGPNRGQRFIIGCLVTFDHKYSPISFRDLKLSKPPSE